MDQATFAEQAVSALQQASNLKPLVASGTIVGLAGLAIKVSGLCRQVKVGDRINLCHQASNDIPAEVVGFDREICHAMTFGSATGLGSGSIVVTPLPAEHSTLWVSDAWIGRVLDPLGQPLDARGPMEKGRVGRSLRADAPAATARARLGARLDVGVRAVNLFATCRVGQRLGLFAGSGIGKSTLLAMMARNTKCDVVVLALVGERGREVRDFLEDDLGADGLARSVVVVATSDMPPLMRREAAYAAMTIAEHFRDAGKSVLLLMDSVTRFCLALREIGLATGEPPATRGYPPSIFTELPRLLERAGPGFEQSRGVGYITALFTVLVEGDDHNEPIPDAVRGILDGHIVLDRSIAERGRFPAIDVLRSLSRSVPGCNRADENALTRRARAILAVHADMADLIRLGAYRAGADAVVDEAVRYGPRIEEVLRQDRGDSSTLEESFSRLQIAVSELAA